MTLWDDEDGLQDAFFDAQEQQRREREMARIFLKIDGTSDGRNEVYSMIASGILPANYADASGKTVLMRAMEMGEAGIVAKLLQKNPDINAQDDNGNTALLWGLRKQNNNALFLLLPDDRIDVNIRNQAGESAVYLAIGNDNIEHVRLLVAKGADLLSPVPGFDTPADYAESRAVVRVDYTIFNFLREETEKQRHAEEKRQCKAFEDEVRHGMPADEKIPAAPRIVVKRRNL